MRKDWAFRVAAIIALSLSVPLGRIIPEVVAAWLGFFFFSFLYWAPSFKWKGEAYGSRHVIGSLIRATLGAACVVGARALLEKLWP